MSLTSSPSDHFDIAIIGAGAVGIPAAIFAHQAGAKVILVDVADKVGGTFHLSSGQMSAAGTRVQVAKGIHDTPELHFQDVMRLSRGTANPSIVRLAVENAADTLHWLLDNGLEILPDHPIIHYGHDPYSIPRTYWGADGGLSVLQVLEPMLDKAVASGGVILSLNTKLSSILQDDSGVVCGIRAERDGEEIEIRAKAVLLGTGGFSANSALFSELSRNKPLYGGGSPYSQGDGLLAAEKLGGVVVNKDKFLPTFAGVEDENAHGGVGFITQTYPQFRQPWEVYIDPFGRRFIREDEPLADARERALFSLPKMQFWAVFDEAIRREAPSFFTPDAPENPFGRFNTHPAYRSADTLSELAGCMEVMPEALISSIEAYNEGIRTGVPDPLGRQFRPRMLSKPPFYAIRHVGWSIVSFAGLQVSEQLQVVDGDAKPIPNLYAAGELLGLGATSGNAFVGGMSVTPAMTFGRLIGSKLGQILSGSNAALRL